LPDEKAREALSRQALTAVEEYIQGVEGAAVTPRLDPAAIRESLRPFDFGQPVAPAAAVDFVVSQLWRHQVHAAHPRYYGLFNPAPTVMGITADLLVAGFNPQLAAWSHSPFANEVERHLVKAFGTRFGYAGDRCDGTFASGGAEANHTALLAALTHAFPEYSTQGVRALPAQPVAYISADGHHSFLKAARVSGLGTASLREVPVAADFRLDVGALAERLREDRRAGLAPFLIVATAGTTAGGIIDPLPELADLAAREGVWLHVDAAWGGAAALAPELRPLLAGIERADSVTFDAHKWLSVPMGAGLFLTRHPEILDRTFRTAAGYMPREAQGMDVIDPYAHSLQWSRRFIGLKVFLSLAAAGWSGYAAAVRRMTRLGDVLRDLLRAAGWAVVNPTPLPVVCFVDGRHPRGKSAEYLDEVVRRVLESGEAWISTVRLGGRQPAVRACITNYRTSDDDLKALVNSLEKARTGLAA
jgi:glutamate/tyrosine decarboxylase-like PLP-dependent enzyme